MYDIVSLSETSLELHVQGDDANCNAAGLYFTYVFTRVEDGTGNNDDQAKAIQRLRATKG